MSATAQPHDTGAMLRLLLPAPRLAWHAQPDDAGTDTGSACSFTLPLTVALDCGDEAVPATPWGSALTSGDAVAWLRDGGVPAACASESKAAPSVRLRLVSVGAIGDAHDRLVANGARPRAVRKPRPDQDRDHDTRRLCMAQGYRVRIVTHDMRGGAASGDAKACDGGDAGAAASSSGGGGCGGGEVVIEAATVAGFHNGVQTLLQWLLLHNTAHTDELSAFPGTADAPLARDSGGSVATSAEDGAGAGSDECKTQAGAGTGSGAGAPWALECSPVEVVDWPDFENRGVMLDVSRDRVWTMDTLRSLVRRLASWKVNQVQLYFEHTFQYRGHREVWEGSGAYSGACAEVAAPCVVWCGVVWCDEPACGCGWTGGNGTHELTVRAVCMQALTWRSWISFVCAAAYGTLPIATTCPPAHLHVGVRFCARS